MTSNIFYGWVVAACAFTILFLTYGAQYSFGVFVPAMLDDLGWTRASLGSVFSLYTVVYTSLSVVSGRLTDTLGPRRVIGIGALLLGAGLILTSQISAPWQMFFCYSLVAALGMSTAYIPCNMTVVRWFVQQRGRALGLASAGASCGFLFTPLLAGYLISVTDWRTALLLLGFVLLILISFVARFMISGPEEIGEHPDGDKTKLELAHMSDSAAQIGLSFQESARTKTFWIFQLAFIVTMLSLTVPFVHLVGHAQDIGIVGVRATLAISFIGLFSLIGSVVLGTLSDSLGRKTTMLIAATTQVVAFVLFLLADGVFTLYCGAAAFGFFYGGFASLFPALVGDLFGRAHAGAIGGVIFGVGGILGGWGPAIAGYLRDVHANFQLAFTCCAVSAALSVVLIGLLPRVSLYDTHTVTND
ncbi:MAG: MFS transporter [Pseudomonadota bacterium]